MIVSLNSRQVMAGMQPGSGGRSRLAWIAVIAVVLLLSGLCATHAQSSNMNRLSLGVGALYERGFDATLSVEHEGKYHNMWEFFGSAYLKYDEDPEAGHITKKSFWHNYNTWYVGAAYKPCVSRGRNHFGNLRLGGGGGSDLHEFIGLVTVGYEHTYCLRSGWAFFFQVKEDVAICAKDLFRTGVVVGVKCPL